MPRPKTTIGAKGMGLSLLLLASLALPPALAGVIVEGAKIVVKDPLQTSPRRLAGEVGLETSYNPYSFRGASTAAIERTNSSGVAQPFALAVKLIAPPGWRGYLKDDRITKIVDMTWSGTNRPWTEVLGELLVSHRLVAVVDWDKKEISFDIAPAYKY